MADFEYEKLEKLGAGTFGKVYKVVCKRTGQYFALRRERWGGYDDDGVQSLHLREIALLKELSECRFIVKLVKVQKLNVNYLNMFFEYCDCNLREFIRRSGTEVVPYRSLPERYRSPEPLPKNTVKSLTYQIVKGVEYLHAHGVMHRDLKPDHILIHSVDSETRTIKICDLGLARSFQVPVERAYTHEVVTLWYRPPEILLGSWYYSTPVDVWSVGCIFAELATKQPLFPGDSEIGQTIEIFKTCGTPDEEVWPGVSKLHDWHVFPNFRPQDLAEKVPQLDDNGIDLLQRFLVCDPSSRLSAQEALHHPYFSSLDKCPWEDKQGEISLCGIKRQRDDDVYNSPSVTTGSSSSCGKRLHYQTNSDYSDAMDTQG
mmetsp:Transcript_42520/g.51634  ORF Transcript_42520/g.51634 Transcript_42520/m.51634 type:complete len:373 (+) Transcript_42520:207-1325(+)|eukprot:CAMPEP_0197847504 /NCGR_PEP_ID=MMETSP1438-20131217/6350_1 /TAXON_ID=1461541 /ORGANISM="Pterosperma sp., Strain CCMP1384" /LENGTH=372 /DNA_ID=CAMNT_0043459445 /DNA_START=201 /DNA_END=1319 /DNA_ORIENTATION=-